MILDHSSIEALRQQWQLTQLRPVGFCSGTFDMLNWGHVEFLRKCKGGCVTLVVGVGRDEQVRRLKAGRPIVPEEHRLKIVNAIRHVDWCFLDPWCKHDLSGLGDAMELIRPQTYFCAEGDRGLGERQKICDDLGVELVQVPRVQGVSTTEMVEKIRATA